MLCFISSPRAIARFAANIAKLPELLQAAKDGVADA
jgi:hypothetical protein